jgi:hypothetical protein
MRAEALDEIARWKRNEPSRMMTFDELFTWLDALDAADENRTSAAAQGERYVPFSAADQVLGRGRTAVRAAASAEGCLA